MLVQKMMSTLGMIDIIAKHFGVSRRMSASQGSKDEHAICGKSYPSTHQTKTRGASRCCNTNPSAILGGLSQHNQLRPGHLRGNRFSIRIRNIEPSKFATRSAS